MNNILEANLDNGVNSSINELIKADVGDITNGNNIIRMKDHVSEMMTSLIKRMVIPNISIVILVLSIVVLAYIGRKQQNKNEEQENFRQQYANSVRRNYNNRAAYNLGHYNQNRRIYFEGFTDTKCRCPKQDQNQQKSKQKRIRTNRARNNIPHHFNPPDDINLVPLQAEHDNMTYAFPILKHDHHDINNGNASIFPTRGHYTAMHNVHKGLPDPSIPNQLGWPMDYNTTTSEFGEFVTNANKKSLGVIYDMELGGASSQCR